MGSLWAPFVNLIVLFILFFIIHAIIYVDIMLKQKGHER